MIFPNVNENVTNRERGFQADLARRMGISRQAVHEILSGKRVPGYRMAVKLERATGVPRLAWMDPNQYHNPLLAGADGNGTGSDS